MIIDGTDITTLGLVLLKADDGLFSLPARKDVLDSPEFEENDIKHKSASFNISIFGDFNSILEMEAALNGFKSLVTASVQHTLEFDEYDLPAFPGAVFANGYSVEVIRTIVKITAKITVADKKWTAS
ncbi:hypothetical protein [Mangrovibacterium sp.]|uniref:hypothetical protein n=1 Tax=Mangrovibacterium sp. TaxID=1961364 RepID=UPI0035685B49